MVGTIIQEVDVIELVKYVDKKNKRLQAILLQSIEQNFEKGSKEYVVLRKTVLDETSDFSRSVVRQIFGNGMEYLVR